MRISIPKMRVGTVRKASTSNAQRGTIHALKRPAPCFDFRPNPKCTMALRELGPDKVPLIIADNLLANPQDWLRFAEENVHFARGPDGGVHFPGVRGPVPDVYIDILFGILGPVIEKAYGFVRDRLTERAMFSLTTTPPQELQPLHKVPHYDGVGLQRLSAVHFMFKGDQGGTAFYRQRTTGISLVTRENVDELCEARDAYISNVGVGEGYLVQSNEGYEQLLDVEPRFDRIVLFPGNLLHSGSVNSVSGLARDIYRGRLTINTFLTQE